MFLKDSSSNNTDTWVASEREASWLTVTELITVTVYLAAGAAVVVASVVAVVVSAPVVVAVVAAVVVAVA